MFYSLWKINIAGLFLLLTLFSNGQEPVINNTDSADLVISYTIDIKSGSKKINVAETYNSGTKTIFISKGKARIRLLSLMRIESIFFLSSTDDSSSRIFRIKESAKKTTPWELTLEEWLQLNNKYDSARCEHIVGETKKILDYDCKKAVIHLADGRTLTTYYTEELSPLRSIYEPAFALIPGLVLEYSYSYNGGSSTYTATSILRESIDPEIFSLQSRQPDKIQLQ